MVPENDISPEWSATWNVGASDATARKLDLEVVDSAYGNDSAVDSFAEQQRPSYEQASINAKNSKVDEAWLLTHRPIFGLVSSVITKDGPVWGSADQAVASQGLISEYGLILSSHIHVTEVVNIPQQPPQIVIGNGGSLLDPAMGYETPTYGPLTKTDGTPLTPLAPPYPAPTSTWVDATFGYAIATPNLRDATWRFSQRDQRGLEFARCALGHREVSCASVGQDLR